jgi:glycerol-3-phosphate dehydrogenase
MAKRADLKTLASQEYDLLVIGGGINGAGVARDAALRGLKVLLVDKADWASGTSSRSTKLIHGGLRYLEHGDLKLVFEASRERRLLWDRLAPHLVKPQAFLLPVYADAAKPAWMMQAGLWLYDMLSLFRNVHNHRMLSPSQSLAIEPSLAAQGLKASAEYWDCRMHDARLCLEVVLSARQSGAACLNYCSLRSVQSSALGHVKAVLRDEEAGVECQVSARVLVNATGPWADATLKSAGLGQEALLRPSKGVHLITRPLTQDHAILLMSKEDHRVFFVIPWDLEGKPVSLVGTTDTEFNGSLEHLRAEDDEVGYLLDSAQKAFPSLKLSRRDILSTYAGVRPLAAEARGKGHAVGTHTREAVLQWDQGILSMVGGKYTTFRSLAQKSVDACMQKLGEAPRKNPSARTPLIGAQGLSGINRNAKALAEQYAVPEASAAWIVEQYGSRAEAVLALGLKDPALREPVEPGYPALLAQAAFAAAEEDACHLSDFYLRRTFLGLVTPTDSNHLLRCAQVMARYAWWSDARMLNEITDTKRVCQGEYR